MTHEELIADMIARMENEADDNFSFKRAAQAALAAIEAQGLAVVPVEPTEGMVRAGRDAENDAQNSPFWLPPEQIALMVYAAMLAASPLRGEG
jgi:hypothetical protein